MADAVAGDDLVATLAALASPHRLRIVGALAEGRDYVSRLSRRLGISRPLLHMHLQRLEAAGLVCGAHEVSADGKAMRYVEVTRFALTLTPSTIAEAAASLTAPKDAEGTDRKDTT